MNIIVITIVHEGNAIIPHNQKIQNIVEYNVQLNSRYFYMYNISTVQTILVIIIENHYQIVLHMLEENYKDIHNIIVNIRVE